MTGEIIVDMRIQRFHIDNSKSKEVEFKAPQSMRSILNK